MVRAVTQLRAEPLSEEAFAPFGALLAVRGGEPDFRGAASDGWIAGFSVRGRPQVMVLRTRYGPLSFSRLERHLGVTQAFVPLGGSPAVLAVAPPSDSPPTPAAVRAFVLDGTAGYVLHAGTWHSLDRYPLSPPGCDWVMITDEETTEELRRTGNRGGELTLMADYDQPFELAL